MSKNFKVGQIWITRGGDKVTITSLSNTCNRNFPIKGSLGHTYSIQGSQAYNSFPVPEDLVTLVTEESTDMSNHLSADKQSIYIGMEVYGIKRNIKRTVLGFDGDMIIVKMDDSKLYAYPSSYYNVTSKPCGFTATLKSSKMAVFADQIHLDDNTICQEFRDKIKALAGQKIKVTVEVL